MDPRLVLSGVKELQVTAGPFFSQKMAEKTSAISFYLCLIRVSFSEQISFLFFFRPTCSNMTLGPHFLNFFYRTREHDTPDPYLEF